MPDPKIVERIRKLLSLGESPNEHEAMLALERANELMEKHQLAMSDVDVAKVERDGMTREDYVVKDLKMKYMWVITLAHAAAKLYDGSVLVGNELHGTKAVFIGTPEDIPMMISTFEYLWGSWKSIVAEDLQAAKEAASSPYRPKDTMKFKLGHGQGFSHRVYVRAQELARQRKDAVNRNTTGTALMVVKDHLLKNYITENHIGVKRMTQSTGSLLGRSMGDQRGRNIALGGAIGGN